MNELTKEITLEEIKKAIEDDTIGWIDDNAVMINHGTDGDVRYKQTAAIDGQSIMVYWDTTADYNEWQSRYGIKLYLQGEIVHRDLDEEEQEQWEDLNGDNDPELNGAYENDESYACDWDDPVAFEIID